MQTAYTVLILLMLVSLSRLVGRVIPLPLPLVQIAAGALLAWPTLGSVSYTHLTLPTIYSV